MKLIAKKIIVFMSFFLARKERIYKEKSLVIVKTDEIGDYILFRNFIRGVKSSEAYKDHRITLIGNSVWKELAIFLDDEIIDNFIWVDKRKFNVSLFYRRKKIEEILSFKYDILINPMFSREFYLSDYIVRIVSAEIKFGWDGDCNNITVKNKKISDQYYTRLISGCDDVDFEFKRNQTFIDSSLGVSSEMFKPYIELAGDGEHVFDKFKIKPHSYVVLFIGAGRESRRWSAKNYAKVSNFIRENYDLEIVLCGSNSELKASEEFEKYDSLCRNLVGKTSFEELMYVIKHSRLIISNETSAPHFAVALDANKIVVISNGNHLGRFVPYPKDMAPQYSCVFHQKVQHTLDSNIGIYDYGRLSNLSINDIKPQVVLDMLKLECDLS